MLLANSLVAGFLESNYIGQGIVLLQIGGSVFMVTALIGKCAELFFVRSAIRRFTNDFSTEGDALAYYLQRRPTVSTGIEGIYKVTCERILRLLAPDTRSLLAGSMEGASAAALTMREIDLVRGACEHKLDEEEIRVESRMGMIAAIIALEPMLGLLGTVWGVLDAFYEMGTAGSANLATIAPSISSALLTTVVGLFVAIPGMIVHSHLNARVRDILSDLEGFVDELMGRIACEFQGRGV